MTSSSMPPGARQAIAGAIVVATLVGCAMSLTVALLSVRLDAEGYSARAIGLNTAASGVATLIGAPFIPWAARTFGVARLLMAALLFGAASLLGFTVTSDYTAWLALRFAEGIAVTVLLVLSEFWITTWAPPNRLGLTIGVYVTTLAAGFAAGPLILTISGTAGHLPFYIGAALFAVAAGPLVVNAGKAPPLDTRSRRAFWTFLRDAPAATFAGLLHGAIEVAGLGLIPVYALRSGLDVAQGALLASLFVIGNSVLQLPLGLLADRIDRRKVLLGLAGLGLVGAVYLGSAGVEPLIVFELVLVFWGGIVGAFYPVGLGLLSEQYTGPDLAGANSAYVMTYALGTLVGPPIIGAGMDLAPPAGLFWTITAFIGLYALVAGRDMLRGRTDRHPSFS